jgi:hypothetical protein
VWFPQYIGRPRRTIGRPRRTIGRPRRTIGRPRRGPLRGRPHDNVIPHINDSPYGINNKKTHATIGDAMDWFKTMTTNEYIRGVKTLNWKPFNKKLWQRNYYEHIIRDEQSYLRISEYIINNPAKWNSDKFYS